MTAIKRLIDRCLNKSGVILKKSNAVLENTIVKGKFQKLHRF